MIARWMALTLLLAVGHIAPVAAGSAPTEPPLIAGTVWVYRSTVTDASGTPRVGTLKRLYGGRTTYRGRGYYYIEETTTVTPETMQRVYLVWSDGHFREAVLEMRDAQHNVMEVLFDKSVPLDVSGNASGQASVLENGDDRGNVPWSFASSSRGAVTVTVPAGTFQATRLEQRFRLGNLRVALTDDSVGLVSVRTEATQVTGPDTVRVVSELMSGPVPGR